MHSLSAVIITFNEEKNIARCVAALKKVSDEIIVIDNFSTDSTIDICNQLHVKIFQKEWMGFGLQKKYGVEKASYNNIIALDADEILDDEAISEINLLKINGFKGVYEIKLHHFYFGKFLKFGQEHPNYKKRIFNREMVNWNENRVHESLCLPSDYPVIKLKGRIDHYSYLSIEQYISKSNLYTSIAAKELFHRDKKNYFFKLLVSPSFTFFNSFILKGGIFDGFHGFVVAMLNGYSNFLKYIKLRELVKQHQKNIP